MLPSKVKVLNISLMLNIRKNFDEKKLEEKKKGNWRKS